MTETDCQPPRWKSTAGMALASAMGAFVGTAILHRTFCLKPIDRVFQRLCFAVSARLPAKVISGPDGKPFLERYHLCSLRNGSFIVLHRFVDSDPDRGFHDHPWQYGKALLLAGGYDELLVPKQDSPRAERVRRSFGPLQVNSINPHQFHRVLLAPNRHAWSLFLMGPRAKPWGFLAHREAHRYDVATSTITDHNDRKGVEGRKRHSVDVAAEGIPFSEWHTHDVNFGAKEGDLEFRPFTAGVQAPDSEWFKTAPTGAVLRAQGIACNEATF